MSADVGETCWHPYSVALAKRIPLHSVAATAAHPLQVWRDGEPQDAAPALLLPKHADQARQLPPLACTQSVAGAAVVSHVSKDGGGRYAPCALPQHAWHGQG